MRKQMMALAAGLGIGLLLWMYGEMARVPVNSAPLPLEPTRQLSLAEAAVTLPLPVPGTALVAEALVSYEGPFLEGATDRPVSGVAALLLHNRGDQTVASGQVILENREQILCFRFTDLLPGERLLVLEWKEQSCRSRELTACYGYAAAGNSQEADRGIGLQETGLCGLLVTNETDRPMEKVEVRYKTYDAESGIFIGGITYSVGVDALAPHETRTIEPYRYVNGCSRVVGVSG